MASRLLDRLKRSLFKGDQGAGPEQEAAGGAAERGWSEDRWEAELEEEDECVTERLGGTLSFDSRGEAEDEAEGEGEGSGLDSDSDFLGESIEEGLSNASPVGPSPSGPLTRQLQDGWRSLRGLGGGSPAHKMHRQADSLSFEVTDASVVQDGASNSTPSTWSSRAAATRPRPSSLAAIPTSAGCTPPCAVATGTRWSAWSSRVSQRLLPRGQCRGHFLFAPAGKKMRKNFTAETIAKRSRAFEQYLSHLCALSGLGGALCVRQFFYLADLQTGQLLIRVGRYQDALGPLLNAKRLQDKLGGAIPCDPDCPAPPPPGSSHWLFTLVGLACCFQEVDQQEEARDHVDRALRLLAPAGETPGPDRPHPLLLPLLRAAVRLSWQTGRDKRRWEELLRALEEQWAGLGDQPSIKEFLVKCDLQEDQEEV
ncbi:sorting nexin-21-like isoform X2 [Entelurus aequoreus]|uniref:sorting nexin-21-like isoform X2 n=1 Tax=Entelurus aequoreus TaxID=161455 RepID=UPI002B1DF399|nr:sorting nexin-21-like isoform X2 [Entelurus aequoreus]